MGSLRGSVGARRTLACALAVAVVAGLAPGRSEPATSSEPAARANERPVLTRFGWRSVLNFYRRTAGLEPVRAERAWREGVRLHSRYMVKNKVLTHDESPSRPYYTAAGDAAGRSSNVILANQLERDWTERGMIERLMASPFHAAAMLDPRLERSAYETYAERRGGTWWVGATLDVIRGLDSRRRRTVLWPADGMQVPLRTYAGGERPDPTASCKGYDDGAGLPIIASFPTDARVRSSSLRSNGQTLDHCVFDRYSYTSRNASEQQLGRQALAARNTVVLVPKRPLVDLHAYSVSLVLSDGRRKDWTFTVGEVEPPVDPRITGGVASRAFQDRPDFSVAWTAVDRQSGVASYDVRWRSAKLDRALGPFKTWQNRITARDATFKGTPGHTYCFITRATDRAGNRSGWSPEVCTTTPLRASDLEAGQVWVPAIGPQFYANAARVSVLEGSTLRTGRIRAKRLALVASRFPASGVVDVLWNGRRLSRIDLAGNGVRTRMLIELPPFRRVRTGRVVVRVVTDDRRVVIEGLGVARR